MTFTPLCVVLTLVGREGCQGCSNARVAQVNSRLPLVVVATVFLSEQCVQHGIFLSHTRHPRSVPLCLRIHQLATYIGTALRDEERYYGVAGLQKLHGLTNAFASDEAG